MLKDDRSVKSLYAPISRTQLNVVVAMVGAALTFGTFFVLSQAVHDEPFTAYRHYDAIVQVGIGTTLMVLWGCCATSVLVMVWARKLAFGWLALLLWAAICLFYLSFCPLGYLDDIEQFVMPAARGSGALGP